MNEEEILDNETYNALVSLSKEEMEEVLDFIAKIEINTDDLCLKFHIPFILSKMGKIKMFDNIEDIKFELHKGLYISEGVLVHNFFEIILNKYGYFKGIRFNVENYNEFDFIQEVYKIIENSLKIELKEQEKDLIMDKIMEVLKRR